MPHPSEVTPALIRELSNRQGAQPLPDADAAAVAALMNGLDADMRALRQLTISDADEPATTYAAIEGQP
jgi:hypothetical protein